MKCKLRFLIQKRQSRFLTVIISLAVCLSVCVTSVIDVSAAQTYSTIFYASNYDVKAYAMTTDVSSGITVSMTASGPTYAQWRLTSTSAWTDYSFRFPTISKSGVNFLANVNYKDDLTISWHVGVSTSLHGNYDPQSCFILFNFGWDEQYALYPTRVVTSSNGYTSLYFNMALPNYYSYINSMRFCISPYKAVSGFYIDTYAFTLTSRSAADKVIDNQDNNASKIIENQDKNTSKIIEQFGSNYSYPDQGGIDDYHKAESGALDKVGSYMQDATNNWGGIAGAMQQYVGGFGAVRSMINSLTSMPFFQVLLMISVAVGSCLLLLGIALSAAKRGGD